MKSFKEDGPSYNSEHSKGESLSELLSIYIKTLDDGRFQFCQTGLINKVLKATGMDHCNFLPTPANIEAPLGTDAKGSEDKIYWPKSYSLL